MAWNIGPLPLDGPLVLAPMAGYTDASFRVLCRAHGAALGVSELISAEGLLRRVPTTLRMLRVARGERPLAIQIYGADPHRVADAAAAAVELARPDLIDLNMGCPARKVVRKGAGAGLLRDPERCMRMAEATVGAVPVPVTAKIRSGFTADEVNAPVVAEALQAAGCSAITLHARPRTQGHSGPVDWDLIGAVQDRLAIPVIGNGGITDAEGARARIAQTGVPAVMIGRAAIGNPWLFGEIRRALAGEPPVAVDDARRLRDIAAHLDGLIAANTEDRLDDAEGRACAHFRGQLVKYVAGRRGSLQVRRRLNELRDREAVLQAVAEVLELDPRVLPPVAAVPAE